MSHSDVQAEKAVIGAVLCGATRMQVADLKADDFTEARPHVWRAVMDLFNQGAGVDHITLSELLKTRGVLAEVGGPAELMRMDDGGRLAAFSGLPQHVGIIRDRARRRRLAAAGKRLEAMSYDLNLGTDRIAAEGAQAAMTAGGTSDGDEAGDVDFWEIHERWTAWSGMTEQQRAQHAPYLPMPWEFMREAGVYGFPESLSVVAGRSGIGKTATLSTCMAYWLRVLPHKGAVIGLEDGTAWLDERWIASKLGLDYAAVGTARLSPSQELAYNDYAEHIVPLLQSKLKKYRRAGMTAGQLLARCRRWVDEGVKWIVVDHGLRVTYESDGRMREDRVIGQTMDALANLGLNYKCHIIVAWHLNRASDDDSTPTLGDLKESGYLDAAARAIYGLWKKGDRTLCTVVKATKVAPVGMTCQLSWKDRSGMFDTSLGRVVDFEREAREAKEAAAAEKQQRQGGARGRIFGGGK
jgi:replicative DNA helicase